ncbi:MAG: copper amine oxidase N-terminal domain-containing protein [Solirubrobacterales bacterium]
MKKRGVLSIVLILVMLLTVGFVVSGCGSDRQPPAGEKSGQTSETGKKDAGETQVPRVFVQGVEVKYDTPPVVEQGAILVPLRATFQAINTDVKWDAAKQTIEIASGYNEKLVMQVGSKRALLYKNSGMEQKMMDVPAKIINGRTYIPLIFVMGVLNANVDWDKNTQCVYITRKR